MSADGIKKLLHLRGIELLDAAASMAGKQPPSQVARPMTTVNPKLLQPTQDEWWRASDHLTAHIEEARIQVATVLANWDVPDGFERYMAQMIRLLQDQQAAVRGVSWQLAAVRETLQKAKDDTDEKISEAAAAVISGIIAALVTAAFSGGAAAAVGLGIIAALIAGLLTWLLNRANIQKSQLSDQNGQLESLKNLVSRESLAKVTPPAAPDLSRIKGFSSIHEPKGI
ncbi:hypothetical protein [Actinomadura rubrisoli]|uniref:Uncharacterized protein n=1 Tax=Actinomadura rubrisoli TaxID=2530368 RepID=A0A4R5A1V4_9ACTN|nr:hypothetical protein [Actinomadura rubrisoli]TDD65741.1 hypothetical protein E1298_41070 [Actinomadura rubrisoli]